MTLVDGLAYANHLLAHHSTHQIRLSAHVLQNISSKQTEASGIRYDGLDLFLLGIFFQFSNIFYYRLVAMA